jgi:hypothetical protein
MPHLTRSGREAIIHAGSFDEPLAAAPERHLHWSSRADWYVHGDELPVQEGGASSTPRLPSLSSGVSGMLDRPPEPVVGLAEGETRWRAMTGKS